MSLTRKQKKTLAEHVDSLYQLRWGDNGNEWASKDDLICLDHDDDELLDAVTHLGLTERNLEAIQTFIMEDLRTTDWDAWLEDEDRDLIR